MDLKGRVAVVTGGSGALGGAICSALAQAGANIVVVYNTSRAKAEALAAELSAPGAIKAVALQADVTVQASIESMLAQALAAFGRIDVLINDAAYNRYIPFADLETLDEAVWNQIMQCNLTGPFLAMRAVAPIMRRQSTGRIVNISSIAGFQPRGSSIAYAVSKSALLHLTRCMAVALAPNVLVNSVSPGYMVGTHMSSNLAPNTQENYLKTSALHSTPTLEDVAAAVMTFVTTDSITGQTLIVDSGVVFH
jgi:3-oxoacyl-[acyl-carrier protein] reductase